MFIYSRMASTVRSSYSNGEIMDFILSTLKVKNEMSTTCNVF
jgi:hypothetical protein